MKIHSSGVELFHADRRKDRRTERHDKAFRNFANMPKFGHLKEFRVA
jgi:hypothetical protein